MGIGAGMRDLARSVVSTREELTGGIQNIKENTMATREESREVIKDLRAARKGTLIELKAGLVRDRERIKSEATGMLGETHSLLKMANTSRKESVSQLREELASGAVQRKAEVSETLDKAQQMLRGFQTSRKTSYSELTSELNQDRSSIKSEVRELLQGFRKSRQEATNGLRKDLARGGTDRHAGVRMMQDDFHRGQAALRADMKEAREAWQGATSTAPEKVEVKAVPWQEPLVTPVTPPVMTGKEATGAVEAMVEEVPGLEDKLLVAIKMHPEGITLSDAAESMGVVPIVLGRASRSLLDNGKVRKEERLYFPVKGE